MSSDAFDPGQPVPPPIEDWAARIDGLLLEAKTAPAGAPASFDASGKS